MLRRLIEFSLSQRMLVLVLAALLAGAGGYAFSRLPIDAYPDISTTQVKLILKAPGMTPEEVEQRVIAPLELELLGIPNQVILRSMAKYAIADITIDFTDSTDVYWARQQVSERLSEAMDALPDTVTGGLAPIATPLSEIFMFTIEGGALSLAERRSLLDWVIRPALRTIPGVADVNALGGFVSSFEVVPDDAALLSAGLRVSDIKSAIEQANRNDGAGRVSDGEEALIVRAVGAIRTLDDLREVMVKNGTGNTVRLGDVAAIRTGSLTRYGAVTKDGKGEAVLDFTEVENGIFEGLRQGEGVFILQNLAAARALNRSTDQMIGDWSVVRGGGRTICGLTLTNTDAGNDSFQVFLKPRCEALIANFAPTIWRIERGELLLISAKRETWRFEADDNAQWRRVPDAADPLLLVRQ